MEYLKFKLYKQITHCRRKNILIEIIPNEIKRLEKKYYKEEGQFSEMTIRHDLSYVPNVFGISRHYYI